MSQENVEVVRRIVEAFNSGELRQAAPHFHPDAEFTSGTIERKTYVGLDGLGQYADDLEEVWENWHSEDNRFLDGGGERVLWLYRIVGQGKGSGVPVNQPLAILWTLRDGLIWRGQVIYDRPEALKAVGLEE